VATAPCLLVYASRETSLNRGKRCAQIKSCLQAKLHTTAPTNLYVHLCAAVYTQPSRDKQYNNIVIAIIYSFQFVVLVYVISTSTMREILNLNTSILMYFTPECRCPSGDELLSFEQASLSPAVPAKKVTKTKKKSIC